MKFDFKQLLTDQQFGFLKCDKVINFSSDGSPLVYECTCLKCNNKIQVSATDLFCHRIRSCGCVDHNDIVGMKFGKLTCVGKTTDRGKDGHLLYRFKCDCGNIILRDKDTVVSRNTTSCGCYQTEQRFVRKYNDLSGRRFGRWFVIKRDPPVHYSGKIKYVCKCECGKIKVISSSDLISGKSTSCGCARKDLLHKSRIDLIGRKFGKLTVIGVAPDKIYSSGRHLTRWVCRCDCGNERIIATQTLLKNVYKSCGDCHRTRDRKDNVLYGKWLSMRSRCYCKSSSSYSDYGGRGVYICDEWKDNFEAFYNWAINNGYKPGLTIDRKNDPPYKELQNGPYAPWNCRWVPMSVQANNRRNNRFVEIDGVSKTLTQWATSIGMTYDNLRNKTDEEIRSLIKK